MNTGDAREQLATLSFSLGQIELIVPIIEQREAALLQHTPMIAITGHKKLYTWIYCSCGFNKEYATHTTEPEAWPAHIRNQPS